MRPTLGQHLAAAALALAAAVLSSSCVLPLATGDQNCTSYCSLLQGCGVPGAPAGDCNAWCSAFATEVEHTGCKTQFDDSASCVVAEGTCQASSCDSQTQAYLDCTKQFCAANPADTACPSM